MRVVLYDDETMEPITVLHLDAWMTDLIEERRRLVLPVYLPLTNGFGGHEEVSPSTLNDRVTIWFERFFRRDEPHWFCFTRDSENALQLRSVFLPGQWPAVHEEYRRGVSDGLVRALGLRLR